MVELRYWNTIAVAERDAVKDILRSIVRDHAVELVSIFYGAFLQHPAASSFLTHNVVQERLSNSLRNWLLDLWDADLEDASVFQRRQIHIGAVHARINLPMHLVLEGASLLKIEIGRHVLAHPIEASCKASALLMLDEIIDYAMRLMSEAYVAGTREHAHTDEAFRLFSIGQDITIERETQRAALMEWSQNVLFSLVTHADGARLEPLASSQFGLWLRHRGAMLFQGSPFLKSMEDVIARIDTSILPAVDAALVEDSSAVAGLIGRLQAAIEEVRFLLTDIFQSATELEAGRDPLTRALNRKFLAAVLGREIALSKRNNTPLSVILFDVDHFKDINDRYGHSGGDVVLRQVADLLLESVRGSDFVFRHGGEEFLIVLVEASPEDAVLLAERVRKEFSDQSILMPDQSRIAVTVSGGVASYDGHPDYEYLVRRADEALYRSKGAGRNMVTRA